MRTPPTREQRIRWGLVFVMLGLGFTVWMWIDACQTGKLHARGALLFPAFATLGLFLMGLPDSDFENQEKYEGLGTFEAIKRMPRRWQIGFVVCLLAGALNLVLMYVVLKYVVFAAN